MSKIREACALAEKWAADPAHGYDQTNRWGPDYDCSSFVTAIWDAVGVPVKTNGASYTGNMRGAFLRSGFSDVTAQINLKTGAGLQGGDVLLNHRHHTAMMVSAKKLVQASINEKGTVTGGQTGDQTGREIYVGNYYNYPWDCVLRYTEDEIPVEDEPAEDRKSDFTLSFRLLTYGCKGEDVRALQRNLKALGFDIGRYGTDGDFGYDTKNALIAYQKSVGIDADGIAGKQTMARLMGVS